MKKRFSPNTNSSVGEGAIMLVLWLAGGVILFIHQLQGEQQCLFVIQWIFTPLPAYKFWSILYICTTIVLALIQHHHVTLSIRPMWVHSWVTIVPKLAHCQLYAAFVQHWSKNVDDCWLYLIGTYIVGPTIVLVAQHWANRQNDIGPTIMYQCWASNIMLSKEENINGNEPRQW